MSALVLRNNVTEAQWLLRFPLPLILRALSPWEQFRLSLSIDVQQWDLVEPFAYVSDKFGRIDIPKGLIVDLASIPKELHSLIDDDSPLILRPSVPHDCLFGSGGKLTDGRQLTFKECNELLVEAMWWCGANDEMRAAVFTGVQMFGASHWPRA